MKRYIFLVAICCIGLFPQSGFSERFLWCWYNDSVTNNIGTAREDLLTFCAAPFADTTKAITYLWYYAEGDDVDNQTNLSSFITLAHSHGLKVVYLDGDPSWVENASGISDAEGFMNDVINYNEAVSSTGRFDGVEMDIEPGSASNWTKSQADTTDWNNFIAILTYCESQVSTYNLSYGPHMYFETTVEGNNWDQQGPVPNIQQVQKICDSVAILDFWNTVSKITSEAIGEITYGNTIGKKVVPGFETSNQAGGAEYTFYGKGDYVMESTLSITFPVFAAYSSFWGYGFEYYDFYRMLNDTTGNLPPIAGFYGTPPSGAGPLTVNFIDTSANFPTSWNWNFGDGGTSTTKYPAHQYAAVGSSTSYSVSLIVTNTHGTSTISHNNYIELNNAPPTAGFYGSPTVGTGPLTVNFMDTSANTPTTWSWDFGDGGTATTQNPSHQYATVISPTCYPVTLIVSNGYGASTATYLNYICIFDYAPNAGFSASPTSGNGPLDVNFTDTSANTPVQWNWDFGDGGTATTQNPMHQYAAVLTPTCYTVTLIASNSYGASTATQSNYICVYNYPPSAGFYATPTSGSGSLVVNFTDTSVNYPTSWNWNFGDGGIATTQNPSHQYASVNSPTCFPVTLIVNNSYGSSTVTKSNYICLSPTVTFTGGVIWDFDSTATTPAKEMSNGYLYLYTTNGVGIGGSKALEIDVPYKAAGARHGGGGLWLSNYAGFTLQGSAPYLGTVGNTANNLSFSTHTIMYMSIIATNTSNFGISFAPYDTSGHFFVAAGTIYVGDSTQLTGSISSTSFQQAAWGLPSMHVYAYGETSGRHPALANIEALHWFFPTSKTAPSGEGSGASELKFYVDNIGASNGTVPVELWQKY